MDMKEVLRELINATAEFQKRPWPFFTLLLAAMLVWRNKACDTDRVKQQVEYDSLLSKYYQSEKERGKFMETQTNNQAGMLNFMQEELNLIQKNSSSHEKH